MYNKKYVVDRSGIHIGKVVSEFYQDTPIYTKNNVKTRTDLISKEELRSIIFTINEEGLSNDLLFNSPNYYVEGITNSKPVYTPINDKGVVKSRIIITNPYNLDKLLKFCNFKDEITYYDIEAIRWTFFSKSFLRKRPDLFGREYNKNAGFTPSVDSPVSEYFDVINMYRDKGGNGEIKVNSFKPPKIEGPIKKLSRF